MGDRTTAQATEAGRLGSGHPFARIGNGKRRMLSIPGLSFTADPPSKGQVRTWKPWIPVADEHGPQLWDIGRRGDLPRGTTAEAVADDYAAVIRREFAPPIGVMGISTGGAYAMWLAIRHPDLVDRLVLGFTAHRLTPEVRALTRRFTDLAAEGRWRSAYALAAPALFPRHARFATAVSWLLAPMIVGRPKDPTVPHIDVDAEEAHDATARLGEIRCPTLIVSGGRGDLYPPALVGEPASAIPAARHIECPDAGHIAGGTPFARDACAFLAT